jgi:hypothetical protein
MIRDMPSPMTWNRTPRGAPGQRWFSSLGLERRTTSGLQIPSVSGTKAELRPGVWRLRVYAGRSANGTPIQIGKTLITPAAQEGRARPGDGTRLADRELAAMVTKYSSGAGTSGAETLSELVDRYIDHAEVVKRLSPTATANTGVSPNRS